MRVNPWRIEERIVIVQDNGLRCPGRVAVRKRADEVAIILMRDDVRHHDAIDLHGRQRNGENVSFARMRRAAVGDVHRHVQPVDDLRTIRPGLAEGDVSENGNEAIFRRLPVFRIHPDVINAGSAGVCCCGH